MAIDCAAPGDTCSNCAGAHRTTGCPRPHSKRCVNCKSDDHASWSRACPSYIKRAAEFNERNPENLLTLFPTDDPWTWSMGATNDTLNNTGSHGTYNKRSTTSREKQPQRQGRNQGSPRRRDTSMPNETLWSEQLANLKDDPPHRWWDPSTTQPNDIPPTPPNNTGLSDNNNADAGPSNTTSYPNV
jgi:hypothetical protein